MPHNPEDHSDNRNYVTYKYTLPRPNNSLTVLHWAAQCGHCEVARYLITELKLDPQDRDKVCGMPGDCAGFKVQGLRVCMI